MRWLLMTVILIGLIGCDCDDCEPVRADIDVRIDIDETILRDLMAEDPFLIGSQVELQLLDAHTAWELDSDRLSTGVNWSYFDVYPPDTVSLFLVADGQFYGTFHLLDIVVDSAYDEFDIVIDRDIIDGTIYVEVNDVVVDILWDPCLCIAG